MTLKKPTPLYNTTSNFGCRQRPGRQRFGPSKCQAWILSFSTNSSVTPAYTMLNDRNSGNSTALQDQRAVSAYLQVRRYCNFIFHTAEWMSFGTVSVGRHSEACIGYIYIHTDFKIPVFIFCRQIYIISIYLLRRPYFNIVVLK